MLDQLGREINYLRISITDRCNLRCRYCMPAEGVQWVEHGRILSYEQLVRLARVFVRLGVDRVRLTGGEPLVRRELPSLIRGLKAEAGVRQVNLTTNGLLLADQLPQLLEAGLDGVNLSLDTLDRAQYARITRFDALPQALQGLDAALTQAAAGRLRVKLNCVPMGENDDQLVPLARLAQDGPAPLDVRFIELMPIGLGSSLPRRTEAQVLSRLEAAFGPALPCPQGGGNGPGRYVRFDGFTGRVGFISAMTHQFCDQCNRVRLTATGFLKTCLQYDKGLELKPLLERGMSDEALLEAIQAVIRQKPACHHFASQRAAGDEGRNMNQIGG